MQCLASLSRPVYDLNLRHIYNVLLIGDVNTMINQWIALVLRKAAMFRNIGVQLQRITDMRHVAYHWDTISIKTRIARLNINDYVTRTNIPSAHKSGVLYGWIHNRCKFTRISISFVIWPDVTCD